MGCNSGPQTLDIGAPGGADAQRSNAALSAIDIGLPDRSQIGANAPALLSGFHLIVVDKSCERRVVRNDIVDYTNTARIDFSLRQNCDYEVTLSLGKKGVAGAPALAATYYKNMVPQTISAQEIAGKPRYNLTLYLQRTPEGQAAGLPDGSNQASNPATNQVTNFVPTASPIMNTNTQAVGTDAPLSPVISGLSIAGASGQTATLGQVFKGKYMMLKFGYAGCPPCVSLAKTVSSDATVKALEQQNKCGVASFVSQSDMSKWVSATGAASAAHSYYSPGKSYSAVAQLFGVSIASTPTVLIVDRQGTVVKKVVGGGLNEFKQICSQ